MWLSLVGYDVVADCSGKGVYGKDGNQGHSICHRPSPSHPQSPLPPHLQSRGQQRYTHLRQQLAEAECPRLQGTET